MTTEEYFAQLQGKLDAEIHNKCLEESVLKSQIEQLQQHLMDCKEEYLELEAKYLVQLELNQALKTALAYSEKAIEKLLVAGRATSNCCYNVGQLGGTVLEKRHANSLWQAAEEWDKVVNEVSKIK